MSVASHLLYVFLPEHYIARPKLWIKDLEIPCRFINIKQNSRCTAKSLVNDRWYDLHGIPTESYLDVLDSITTRELGSPGLKGYQVCIVELKFMDIDPNVELSIGDICRYSGSLEHIAGVVLDKKTKIDQLDFFLRGLSYHLYPSLYHFTQTELSPHHITRILESGYSGFTHFRFSVFGILQVQLLAQSETVKRVEVDIGAWIYMPDGMDELMIRGLNGERTELSRSFYGMRIQELVIDSLGAVKELAWFISNVKIDRLLVKTDDGLVELDDRLLKVLEPVAHPILPYNTLKRIYGDHCYGIVTDEHTKELDIECTEVWSGMHYEDESERCSKTTHFWDEVEVGLHSPGFYVDTFREDHKSLKQLNYEYKVEGTAPYVTRRYDVKIDLV